MSNINELEELIVWIALNRNSDIDWVLMASQTGTKQHPMPVREYNYRKAEKFMEQAKTALLNWCDRETKKAIDNYFKDKAVFAEFECREHGKVNPSEIMPECPKCLVELTEESKR